MKDLSLETWVSPTLMRKKRELLALSWSSASAWKTLKTNGPENKTSFAMSGNGRLLFTKATGRLCAIDAQCSFIFFLKK